MNRQDVLPDTTLCTIVRDEKMNAAGGIQRFVDSHVPFVESAIIADTGSVDGTRQILEEAKARYSNLKIIDIPFNGFADARNKAMKHVQTKRALILDADELLTHKTPQNDWKILNTYLTEVPYPVYNFEFKKISPDKEEIISSGCGTTKRIIDMSASPCFNSVVWENLTLSKEFPVFTQKAVIIKHFVPSEDATFKKAQKWYKIEYYCKEVSDSERLAHYQTPPSKAEGFAEWKAFNPRRNNYE